MSLEKQIDAEIARLEQEKKELGEQFIKNLNQIHEKSIKRHDEIHQEFMESLEKELNKIYGGE